MATIKKDSPLVSSLTNYTKLVRELLRNHPEVPARGRAVQICRGFDAGLTAHDLAQNLINSAYTLEIE